VADDETVRLYPLEFSVWESDADRLVDEAERDAGIILTDGFASEGHGSSAR